MKKLGAMLNKVLSCLVISTFILSNAGYAMPTTAGAAKVLVDNMALRSFLQTGNIADADKEAFQTMLKLLTANAYTPDQLKGIIELWAKNYASVSTEERLQTVNETIKEQGKVEIDDKGNITITRNGKFFGSISKDGTNNIDIAPDVITGESGKAKDEATRQKMASDLIATAKEVTLEQKAEDAKLLKTVLDEQVAMKYYDQADADDLITLFQEVKVNNVAAIVLNKDNYLNGSAAPDAIYIDGKLKDRARIDLIIHELLEIKNGFDDKKALAEQMKLYNVTDATRKNTDTQMGKTRAAMEESRKPLLEAAEGAAQKPQVSFSQAGAADILKADTTKVTPEQQENAVQLATDTGIAPELIDKAGAGIVTIMQQVIMQHIDATVKKFTPALERLFEEAEKMYKTVVILTQLQKILDSGQRLSITRELLLTNEKNGSWLPTFTGSMILWALQNANLKEGAVVDVISAGEDAKAVQDALDLYYPKLRNIIKVHAGNEASILPQEETARKEVAAKLTVLFGNKDSIAGNIEGVIYIQSTNKNRDNGLALLMTAFGQRIRNELSVDEQAQLDSMMNQEGNIYIPQVGIADEATYKAMSKDYEEFINILIQA